MSISHLLLCSNLLRPFEYGCGKLEGCGLGSFMKLGNLGNLL